MAIRIRACCPQCNEIDLTPSQIQVRAVHNERGEVTDASTYRFICPGCDQPVVKPADVRIIDLLGTGGVAIEVVTEQSKGTPPADPATLPPLSVDDLASIRELLACDTWFDQLLEVIAATDQ